jgi:DeoR/GlpR family transcriptional regulator of sugar metabolism
VPNSPTFAHNSSLSCSKLLQFAAPWCIVIGVGSVNQDDAGGETNAGDSAAVAESSVRSFGVRRHSVILAEVRRRGSARVTELAGLLGVSEMTIRRDLEVLDQAGSLIKVHGGAITRSERSTDEPGFVAKSVRSQSEKQAIAAAAAELVSAGAAIGITAGTTTWRFAQHLLDVAELTVVTNSVRVADVFHASPRPDRTVILTGGIRTPSDALVGPLATAVLRTMHLDAVFMGVHGMSDTAGYTTPNLMEAETNRSFVAAAEDLVVLADHSKWNMIGLCAITPLGAAAMLVTDDEVTDAARDALNKAIPQVIYAPASTGLGSIPTRSADAVPGDDSQSDPFAHATNTRGASA